MALSQDQKKALVRGVPGASYAKEPFGWDTRSKAMFANVEALLAKAWTEGFDKGFYDPLAGGSRDASESVAINPYEEA